MTTKSIFHAAALGLTAALAAPVANAQVLEPPVDALEINMVGVMVGSAPDYSGSSNNQTVGAPVVRYQFEGTKRYFLWLGPTMYLNLINDQAWRAGPMLNYRAKRDDDVDDQVVKQMTKIDAEVEGGVFLQYNMKLSNQPLHQLVFAGDVAGSGNGTIGHLRMTYWHPFSEKVIGTIGVGGSFANDKYMETYYGVMGSHDAALFGGTEYKPSSGTVGIQVPFAVSIFMDKKWLLTVGGRYEGLQGDAKDSPIVSKRGDSDQWIGGIGVSYLF